MSEELNPIFTLLKFGKAEHLAKLRSGQAYMNGLSFFRSIEGDAGRADNWECATRVMQPENVEMKFSIDDGKTFMPIGTLTRPMIESNSRASRLNVFCAYAIRKSHIRSPRVYVNPRNRSFGDSWVVVLQADEFLRRFERAAEAVGHTVEHRIVEYVDEHVYEGDVGAFRKRSCFAYQSEYRIVLAPGVDKPLELHLGDLKGVISDPKPYDTLESSLRAEDVPAAG